jgi:serine/threonine-protein kinase
VALKLLHPAFATHPDLVERFRREAQIAVKLRSPHVVEVLDFGQTQDGRFYLAMEVLEGESLQALLERERRVAPDRASGMLRQLLNGLGAIHAQGIVHRDLKPENLWLVPRPEGALLKILDFGIARLNDLPEGAARTQLGMVLGTPEYLSPEQARGQAVDARADLYNVGLMAFVLLTGRHPFHTGDVAGLLQSHAFAPLPDLTTLVPDLAGVEAWQQFIAIATQKDPAMRAQTAEQLLGLLPGPPEGAGTLIRTGPVAQPLLAELPQGRPGRASIQIEIPTQLHRALSWTRSGAVSAQKRFRALPATQQRVGVGLAAAALLGLAALTFTSRGPLGQVEKALDAGDGEKALRLLEPMGTTPEIECLRGHALHLQRRPDEGLARYKLVADASPALLTKVDPTADLLEDLKGSHSKEVTDLLVTAHATDALLKATQDSESYRRRTAGIDGLRRLHRDDLADSVQIALYDLNVDDCDVQKSAAKRLADLGDKLGDKRGVEPLRALANRKSLGGLVDACAAGAARQALKKLDK